jgi:Hydrogen maturase F tetramerization domain
MRLSHIQGSGSRGAVNLAIHCGACMIDRQKTRARLTDLREAGVPVTNYGLFLSYATSPAALRRALEPWGLFVDVAEFR